MKTGRSEAWYRGWFGTSRSQVQILPPRPCKNMKKAKIYKPTKTAMQSGIGKTKKWLLEFETRDKNYNSLMGWESSEDTLDQVKLEFDSKEKAITYAVKNNISYVVVEPKNKEFIIKSYADNFLKE